MAQDIFWTKGKVSKEYHGKQGRGATLTAEDGKEYGVNCYEIPQSFTIGQEFDFCVSFGKVIHINGN